ncbi:MAG: hypothetical protein U0992_19300 [Planctomycetaceae bacterium]
MVTRKACRNFVGWSGFVVLLLLAAYWGSYYRMVQPVQTAILYENRDIRTVEMTISPYYRLPWPFSMNVSHPLLRPKIESVFGPANAFDRLIRPHMWATRQLAYERFSEADKLARDAKHRAHAE